MSRLPEPLYELLADIRRVGVITGAGISAESGIPTYRGIGGLYDDPQKGDEMIESLSGHTLASDPDRTWRAVADLARHAGGAKPNDGHRAIVEIEIEESVPEFTLLTQNVDGLHQAAGSRNVIAVHGSIRATRCLGCGLKGTLAPELLASLEAAPTCSGCGGTLRPDAVLFGEMLDADVVRRMYEAFSVDPPNLVLVVGTSALFPYITGPVLEANRRDRLTIEINPERTYLSPEVKFHLAGTAGFYLPLIASALRA
ncbi:MAG: SIR2 family NAD-dependent protein deacylase [Planctomycetota bacterium]